MEPESRTCKLIANNVPLEFATYRMYGWLCTLALYQLMKEGQIDGKGLF